MARGKFAISRNSAFVEVINACANRENGDETWITSDMIEAYSSINWATLTLLKYGTVILLIGGIYGLKLGVFFAVSLCLAELKMAQR